MTSRLTASRPMFSATLRRRRLMKLITLLVLSFFSWWSIIQLSARLWQYCAVTG